MLSFAFRRPTFLPFAALTVATGLLGSASVLTSESLAADFVEANGGSARVGGSGEGRPFVGWQEVESAVGREAASAVDGTSATGAGKASAATRRRANEISLDRLGAALPPRTRGASGPVGDRVQATSLAGVASAFVPAVTGDLYWSQPAVDMRIIGQSIGRNSSLRLSRPSGPAFVGELGSNPALVGVK